MKSFDHSIAQILSMNCQEILGTGFAISTKYVLTCKHVIDDVLKDNNQTIEDTIIFINFPNLDAETVIETKIHYWESHANDPVIDDIAVLEVINHETRLVPVTIASLHSDEYLKKREFDTYGFNRGSGDWASGETAGRVADQSIQLNVLNNYISEGFSGAPVRDSASESVIGMLVLARPDESLAYMIPSSVLERKTPILRQYILPDNPYRGLDVFHEKHQKYFFGRDELSTKVCQKIEESPFLLLIGNSGSGKSSLINAGVIPKLRRHFTIIKARPKDDPFAELAHSFATLIHTNHSDKAQQRIDEAYQLTQNIKDDPAYLSSLCRDFNQREDKKILIIIDQFEELYTNNKKDTQQCYFESLAQLIQNSQEIHLLLSLRADFMPQLANHHKLTELSNQYSKAQIIISGMERASLEQAIIKPAKVLEVHFETGLVERILRSLPNEGQLPLLEFALSELWKYQDNKLITHQALEKIGGIHKAITTHADSILNAPQLKQHKKDIEQIMMQLVTMGEGQEDTRRIANQAIFSTTQQQAIKKLADYRLITASGDLENQQQHIEIIHEVLIREWGTLQAWINKHRNFRIWQERLRDAALNWNNNQQQPSDLLSGSMLAQAKEYLENTDYQSMFSQDDQSFIRISIQFEYKSIAKRKTLFALSLMLSAIFITVLFQSSKRATLEANNANETRSIAQAMIKDIINALPQEGKEFNAKEIEDILINSKLHNTESLTSLSLFYRRIKKDYEKSEKTLHKAIKYNPNNAHLLFKTALFYEDWGNKKKWNNFYYKPILEQNKAKFFYEKSIKIDPDNIKTLLSFAYFCERELMDYNQAEKHYNKIIKIDPRHTKTLRAIADFYNFIRKDYNQAEKYYIKAINTSSENIEFGLLSNLAILYSTRKDYNQAEKYYIKAINTSPNHANSLGNLSQITLGKSNYREGKSLLQRAFKANQGEAKPLDLELWFYCLAHFPTEYPEAKRKIIELLKQGVRSEGWDFSINIEQAKRDQHQNIPLLEALADVISDKKEFETLEPFLNIKDAAPAH